VPTGVLVAVGTVDFESEVLAAVAGSLTVVRRCVDLADLLATAATRQAEVAILSVQDGLDVQTLARLRDEGLLTVGVAADPLDGDLLHGIGVDLVIGRHQLLDLAAQVAAARRSERPSGPARSEPDRLSSRPSAGPGGPVGGCVLAVWGPAGAPGRSTVAAGLAAAIAEIGTSCLLVDADVYGGSQAQLLGLLDESSGLLAAARVANRGRLDAEQLAGHARAVSPTLRVLSGLPRPDRWVELGPPLLLRILEAARMLCPVTVVDCGFSVELDEELSYDVSAPRRNGATVAALKHADRRLVVGAADPVGLGRLLRALVDFDQLAPSASAWVVVNRMRPTLGWSADEVATIVRRSANREVAAFLPDDRAACDRALIHGQTLFESARGSRLTKSLGRLAEQLLDDLGTTGRRRRAG
jgi:MinD-like ATPase involved in chromosome partitioning or flagellar assembly